MTGFDADGETIGPQYETAVLRRNRSPLYASLDWLKENAVISDADIGAFNRVRTCRNVLAHRLLTCVGTDGMPPDFESSFEEMVALLRKIQPWWIIDVELPTNPDFDDTEVDESGIIPGPVMGLQLLHDIAHGSPDRSRYYYEEFKKQTKRSGINDGPAGELRSF
ncbi:MAG TPA: hypothetical protein VK324_14890 [Tepidisphaeraceae bacterium]|nr:hypothetical protein [Tepidisphaeraceae bacterium]